MAAAVEIAQPLIYSPKTVSETLAFLSANPGSQLMAGGTARTPASPVTVSVHLLDELRRIAVGERAVDVGAAVTLATLIGRPASELPAILELAVKSIGTSALRNLGTLGGNLCQSSSIGDLFPVLVLLGAQIEIRGQRGSRWLALSDVADSGHIPLGPAELLTRVRIPQDQPGLHFFEKVGSFRTPWEERLTMVCLASPKDDLLTRFRLVFSLPHIGLVRHRELEAELTGRRLPISSADREGVLERFDQLLLGLPLPVSVFQRERILHMTRWVLTRLDDD